MDGKGKDASCDCYVKVKLAAKQYQTKPKMGELNPTFNNEFKFEARLDATGELTFELWDSDAHADDFIGRCSMPIAKVISEGKMEKNFDVYDNNMMPVISINSAVKDGVLPSFQGQIRNQSVEDGFHSVQVRLFQADDLLEL